MIDNLKEDIHKKMNLIQTLEKETSNAGENEQNG